MSVFHAAMLAWLTILSFLLLTLLESSRRTRAAAAPRVTSPSALAAGSAALSFTAYDVGADALYTLPLPPDRVCLLIFVQRGCGPWLFPPPLRCRRCWDSARRAASRTVVAPCDEGSARAVVGIALHRDELIAANAYGAGVCATVAILEARPGGTVVGRTTAAGYVARIDDAQPKGLARSRVQYVTVLS